MADTGNIYGWDVGTGGTRFHRIDEPLRVAGELGMRTGVGHHLGPEVLDRFDTVLVYELTQPEASAGWQRLARVGDTRMIFDIDDAMWDPDWPAFRRYYTPEVVKRLYDNASVAHVVTTSSPIIAEHMHRYNRNVWLVPYSMPAWLLDVPTGPPVQPDGAEDLQPARPWVELDRQGAGVIEMRRELPRRTGLRRAMGFAGSASHEQDMDGAMVGTMVKFLRDHPNWDWHFWGKRVDEVMGWPRGRVVTYPWTDDRQQYFRSLRADAIMAPLKRTLFNRCKSALRFIENSALGVCSILQELDPYYGYADHGRNAFLVGPSGFPTWTEALHAVATDDLGRARVASTARAQSREWTTEALFHRWVQAWDSV